MVLLDVEGCSLLKDFLFGLFASIDIYAWAWFDPISLLVDIRSQRILRVLSKRCRALKSTCMNPSQASLSSVPSPTGLRDLSDLFPNLFQRSSISPPFRGNCQLFGWFGIPPFFFCFIELAYVCPATYIGLKGVRVAKPFPNPISWGFGKSCAQLSSCSDFVRSRSFWMS